MTNEEKCLNCKFFAKFKNEDTQGGYSGLCNAFPPIPVLLDASKEKPKYEYKKPITKQNGMCSFFKAGNQNENN